MPANPDPRTALVARLREMVNSLRFLARDEHLLAADAMVHPHTLMAWAEQADKAADALAAPPPVPGSEVLCPDCALVFCPHGERLHFHHDGCPACVEDAVAPTHGEAETRPTQEVVDEFGDCLHCGGSGNVPARRHHGASVELCQVLRLGAGAHAANDKADAPRGIVRDDHAEGSE